MENGTDCKYLEVHVHMDSSYSVLMFWQHNLLFALPVILNLCQLHFFSVILSLSCGLVGINCRTEHHVWCVDVCVVCRSFSEEEEGLERSHVLGLLNTLGPSESVSSG